MSQSTTQPLRAYATMTKKRLQDYETQLIDKGFQPDAIHTAISLLCDILSLDPNMKQYSEESYKRQQKYRKKKVENTGCSMYELFSKPYSKSAKET